MGYTALIQKSVALAFKQAGDLKRELKLQKSGSKSFNFTTGDVDSTGLDEYTVMGLFLKKNKASDSGTTFRSKLLFESAVVVDLTVFDSVLDGETLWKIESVLSTDGFITLASVTTSTK